MITAILIDDEKNALDVLSSQLQNYCPHVNILAKCQSGQEGIDAINAMNPNLIFLDIEMPKVNGFDVLDQTRNCNYKVIFTTAYDQFAIKAFKYSTLDYLLKPIDIEELKTAVKKLSSEANYNLSEKLNSLFEHYKVDKSRTDRIALPIGEGYELVPFQNVVRCESESNYTTIHLSDNRKITLSKTLKDVEQILNNLPFFRLHNSHLINIDFVSKFYKNDGGYVVMRDGTQINISRARKEEFFDLMNKV